MTSLGDALRAAIWAQALSPPRARSSRPSRAATTRSRQRVNQALQALEKQGLLRVEYGGVMILDLEGLRNHGT